jgi:hypothetical protein
MSRYHVHGKAIGRQCLLCVVIMLHIFQNYWGFLKSFWHNTWGLSSGHSASPMWIDFSMHRPKFFRLGNIDSSPEYNEWIRYCAHCFLYWSVHGQGHWGYMSSSVWHGCMWESAESVLLYHSLHQLLAEADSHWNRGNSCLVTVVQDTAVWGEYSVIYANKSV